ncbi:MAG TPA: GAF domain-containing protein [Trebonia sp.]|nr:GAF domain-containing protein [Trebonia sp.]
MSVTDQDQARPSGSNGRDLSQRRLLQSIVEVARTVFCAAAASVFLVDQDSGDLVFEAVCGEGEGHLVGSRFPADTGIAGWVASSGQPLLVDDVSRNPQFAPDAAKSTGYVPRSIMAAPLISHGECLGVIEVLDRGARQRGDLGDVDLLGLLAGELGIAVELLSPTGAAIGGSQLDVALLQRVAERLPSVPEPVASTVASLLAMVDNLLSRDPASG